MTYDDSELEAAIRRHPAKGNKTIVLVTTESGANYQFDLTNMRVRRVSETKQSKNMRKDFKWNPLVTVPTFKIGEPMRFALLVRDDDIVTLRTTTTVVKVVNL